MPALVGGALAALGGSLLAALAPAEVADEAPRAGEARGDDAPPEITDRARNVVHDAVPAASGGNISVACEERYAAAPALRSSASALGTFTFHASPTSSSPRISR